MQTLREELRKVQTSAALLERQRNPGVGYWAQSHANGSQTRLANGASSAQVDSPAASILISKSRWTRAIQILHFSSLGLETPLDLSFHVSIVHKAVEEGKEVKIIRKSKL